MLAPQTGSSYLAAVRSMQIFAGLTGPKGFIFPPYSEEGPGWHKEGKPTSQADNNSESFGQDSHSPSTSLLIPTKCISGPMPTRHSLGFFRLGELLVDTPRSFRWSLTQLNVVNGRSQLRLFRARVHEGGKSADEHAQ